MRDPDWHARLASAGVRRLQVNVDDEPVADALRLQTFDEPVRAVVSVWTDGEVADAVSAVSAAGPRVVGWRVDERRPLDPPETADGSRADALANVAILRRPEELARDEWLRPVAGATTRRSRSRPRRRSATSRTSWSSR